MRTMRRRKPRPAIVEPQPALDSREIDVGVNAMFAHIPAKLEAAAAAFLTGDREAARRLVETDPTIDALQDDIEELVQTELSRQPLSPDDLRYLVTVLRIVPELERSADLVEHIALRAQHALSDRLSPRARGLIDRMGVVAVNMWSEAAVAYRHRDASTLAMLRESDDELDDLHVQLTGHLANEPLDASVAIELGLVARFFERLGDHAVNVVGRLAYIDEQRVVAS